MNTGAASGRPGSPFHCFLANSPIKIASSNVYLSRMQAIDPYGTRFSKLLELRAKTDRQLAALLQRTLAGGVRCALEASRTGVPQLSARAAQAYQEAQRLLPYLREGGSERWRIEGELEHLRRLLDEAEMSPARAGAA